jgi:guanine deaminase
MTHQEYMKKAFEEAFSGIRSHKGGPFGAVVVMDGKIIGKGCNMVTSTNDPTAHAEVVAIRNACKSMNKFHLPEAVLYTTCEPCPMCLSAIYWANISKVYYSLTRIDSENIGFIDKFLYDEINTPLEKRKMLFERIKLQAGDDLFNEWKKMTDKIHY